MSASAAAMTLLAYQSAFNNDPHPFRVIEKSRRIGISWAVALHAVMLAAAAAGCDVWYVGYNKDGAKEFVRDCAFWTGPLEDQAAQVEEGVLDDDEDILTYTIRFASNFRITALSSRPSNLRNKKGLIIIDEAAHVEELDELLKSALAVTVWGGQGKVIVISTHSGVENPFNKLVEDIRAGRRPASLHRVTFQDAVEQGLYRQVCAANNEAWSIENQQAWEAKLRGMFGEAALEELDVVPARQGSVFLPRVLIEERMCNVGHVVQLDLPDDFLQWTPTQRASRIDDFCAALNHHLEKLPKDRVHFFGEDFGRVSDLTVIAVGYIEPNLTRRMILVVELSKVPFEAQKQILFHIVDQLPRLGGGALDATGNGAWLAEVVAEKYGDALIEQVKLSDAWYASQLPHFKGAFEDNTIALPRHENHLTDLAAFKIVSGIPKLPKNKTGSTSGARRHGDAAIAYALSFYASRREGMSLACEGYVGIPKRFDPRQGTRWLRADTHYDDRQPTGRSWKGRRGGLL